MLSEGDQPKVLLVDDEATGRRLLRRWVERGFDAYVVEANNGLEALEALAAEEFDLVVLDLMMPVLDGTETLSLIRSDPSHGDIEVVVATQLASEQKVRDIISLGVADYILKPLRYESVVDRLHQIVNRARQKKKERLRHSDLPTILVADPDPNFCDFAVSALSGRFHGIAARTAAETLVGVLKNEPELVMLSATLPGLRFEMLGKKVLALAKARHGKVCLIVDTRSDSVDEAYAGQIVRTFVPETFSNEVAKLVAGAAAVGGEEPWLKALEPEITTAVRQAMGMMTGFEPAPVAQPSGGDPDLFGMIDLQAQSGEFDLVVDLRCPRAFAVALCNTLLGGESAQVDDEFLMSGVGEILNVVGGRIKNSCSNRKIEVLLGLPKLLAAPPPEPDSFYSWQQHFRWQENHWFRLGVCGTAGTARPHKGGEKAEPAPTAEPKAASPSLPPDAATGKPATDSATDTSEAKVEVKGSGAAGASSPTAGVSSPTAAGKATAASSEAAPRKEVPPAKTPAGGPGGELPEVGTVAPQKAPAAAK
jgi:CheY-like chemotaxis protein